MGAVRIALLVVGASAAAGCGGTPSSGEGEAPQDQRLPDQGTVASVTDGDTLRLSDGRRVRLVQVDAPEADECYANDARAALRRLTPVGTVVTLDRDPRLDGRDEYGRLLRYVVSRGVEVNVALVRQGAAVPYFFRGERGEHAARLLAAARAARRAGIGMWGACRAARLDPLRGALSGPR